MLLKISSMLVAETHEEYQVFPVGICWKLLSLNLSISKIEFFSLDFDQAY